MAGPPASEELVEEFCQHQQVISQAEVSALHYLLWISLYEAADSPVSQTVLDTMQRVEQNSESEGTMADLREWLARVEKIGELKTINEADPELEIGALTEINDGKRGPALLFESIKGCPQGHRLLSSALITSSRLGLALGVEPAQTIERLLSQLEGKPQRWEAASQKFSPKVVQSGPVMENTVSGSQLDLLQFPAPLWNDQDGGRYLGTGDIVVTRDPQTGIVNLGTYRTMVHDAKRLGLYISTSQTGLTSVKTMYIGANEKKKMHHL